MHRCVIIAVSLASALLLTRGAQADYKQAVAYYMQGRFDRAIQELKPDLDKNPDWESGHRLLGLSYLNLHNNALAISSLTRAVQLKSTAFSTYQGLAQAYYNMQKYDDCIQTLNAGEQFASAKDPKEQSANLYRLHHLRGTAYYSQEKYNEAVGDLTEAIRINQTDWSDYGLLGISLYGLTRYDEAIQALQQANTMKPGQSVTAEYLGKAYLRKGIAALSGKQYSEAIGFLQRAGEYAPRDGYVFFNLAEAHLFLKDYADSEKALIKAAEVMPQNPDVYSRLGLVYEKQKKWEPSLKAYQKAAELKPSEDLKEAIERVTAMKKTK
jgi:protein O-GlcNAc transferase